MTAQPRGQETLDAALTAASVTKSDTTLVGPTRGLYIGGAGDVAVQMFGDTTTAIVFKAVPVGTFMPVNVARVMSTDTTASLIVALY